VSGFYRCAFFGGPWADEVRIMPSDQWEWAAPIPPVIPIIGPPSQDELTLRIAVYRADGLDDDGTRRYYVNRVE